MRRGAGRCGGRKTHTFDYKYGYLVSRSTHYMHISKGLGDLNQFPFLSRTVLHYRRIRPGGRDRTGSARISPALHNVRLLHCPTAPKGPRQGDVGTPRHRRRLSGEREREKSERGQYKSRKEERKPRPDLTRNFGSSQEDEDETMAMPLNLPKW